MEEKRLPTEESLIQQVGDTLKEIRMQRKQSIYKVSRNSFATIPAIEKMEEKKGSILTLNTILKLTNYYGLSLSEFFDKCNL